MTLEDGFAVRVRPFGSQDHRNTLGVQPHSPQCSALVPACAGIQRLLAGPLVRRKVGACVCVCVCVCVCEREREKQCMLERK